MPTVWSLLALVKYVHPAGAGSEGVAEAYDAQEEFMSMEPEAPWRAPKFLRAKRFEARIQSAPTPESFWKVLTRTSLLTAGFTEDEVEGCVNIFVTEKILKTVSELSSDVWLSALQKLPPPGDWNAGRGQGG